MTAIALLDVAHDPHLVADTLLSAPGSDPSANKRLWLPALGYVRSEWSDTSGPFHLSRLARKTFSLPNHSGIVAFAGSCSAAFALWAQLSEMIKRNADFDPCYRVDAYTLQSALRALGTVAQTISLLGILVDAQRARTPFVHGMHREVTTDHFGTCFVAGSGMAMVEQTILAADRAFPRTGWPTGAPLTPCEDLAERLSAEMLYREGARNNGQTPGSPIALGCGGFYEWYTVTTAGVRCLQPRLDLHVHANRDGLVFNRIYFAEQHELVDALQLGVPSQRYFLVVMNLGLEPIRLDRAGAGRPGYTLRPEASWLTLLESAFSDYDRAAEQRTRRMEGPLDDATMEFLFAQRLALHRIRLLLCIDGEAGCISDRLVRPDTDPALATLRIEDGALVVDLAAQVTEKIAKRVWGN